MAMRALVTSAVGGPLCVASVARPTLRRGEALIAVRAAGVNRADLLQRDGRYPPPPGESSIIGLEVAGEITAIAGEDATGSRVTPLKVGDRVMALLSGGGYAEYVAAPLGLISLVPEGMPFEEAAAVPEAFITAHGLLARSGALRAEESILIHAAASGVGMAALQLANVLRAREIIATTSTPSKMAFCQNLGASEVVHIDRATQKLNFSEKILHTTNNRGVDVLLDCVGGGGYFDENLKSLALDGRWVLYGLLGGYQVEHMNLAKLLGKRISLVATAMRSRPLADRVAFVRAFSDEILPLFASGRLKVELDRVYPFESVSEAHARMECGANAGKIILTLSH